MRKVKDPDPYIWLMDPETGGPKSCGSRSPTLVLGFLVSDLEYKRGLGSRNSNNIEKFVEICVFFVCFQYQAYPSLSAYIPSIASRNLSLLINMWKLVTSACYHHTINILSAWKRINIHILFYSIIFQHIQAFIIIHPLFIIHKLIFGLPESTGFQQGGTQQFCNATPSWTLQNDQCCGSRSETHNLGYQDPDTRQSEKLDQDPHPLNLWLSVVP